MSVIKTNEHTPSSDVSALWGLMALKETLNNLSEGLSTIVTAGTNTTLTVAQLLSKNIVLTSGASGAFTLTLPGTTAILTGFGNNIIPTDGTFYFPLYICNQGVGQTMTLTAGDSSTTVSSTENTLATNISGKWMVQVATASTLVITRVFGGTN